MATFMDACYIARRNAISEPALTQFQDCVTKFHHLRESFIALGVRSSISLPCQHSLSHYRNSIRLFGSPNGVCSSITESKHIKAVKEPWRRSSRFNALKQMLRTLERLSKMSTLRQIFSDHKMTGGTTSSYTAGTLNTNMDTDSCTESESNCDGTNKESIVINLDDENDDEGPVAGSQPMPGESFSEVKLAPKTRTSSIVQLCHHLSVTDTPFNYLQKEAIRAISKGWQASSTSPLSLSACANFYTNSTIPKVALFLQQSMICPLLTAESMYITLLLRPSMHQVTYVVQVACIASVSDLRLRSMVLKEGTQLLSFSTRIELAWRVWLSHGFGFFSLSPIAAVTSLVPS